jgi:hypothetical protein
LVENLQVRKRSLRTIRRKWEDNIRMDVSEIGYEVWTAFIWLRTETSEAALVNTVINT